MKHTTNDPTDKIPYGYCHCGCGQKTWIPVKTQTRYGYVKGQPVRFVHGHGRRKRGSLADAFWKCVTLGDPDDCWEWQGGKADGYGQLYYRRRQYKTHRLAYELHNGPIPEGMLVCHTCDNPPCCNPAHLFLGTRADNHADMLSKGRNVNPCGEQSGSSKLTESDVVEIRRLHKDGMSQAEIARKYKMSQVYSIVHYITWKHIP